jgi:ubiquinone/menaquinone biosynthesis C-methylase UbiE
MAERVCPWWLGYLLASPLRRLFERPEPILRPYIKPGMVAVDIGCGMGFFSLPLARMVGPNGRVVCVDLQTRMISSLRRRAQRSGVIEQMDLRICAADSLGVDDLAAKVNFILAYAVVHEVPDKDSLMSQIRGMLAPEGCCLLAEPSGHVNPQQFAATLALARNADLEAVDNPRVRRSHAAVLKRGSS